MFTMYSKPNCSQCVQAKALLTNLKLDYQEIKIVETIPPDAENTKYILRDNFIEKYPQQKSLPYILNAGGTAIGGFAELKTYLFLA